MSEQAAATQPQSPAWIADLPEDLRSNATLSSFKGNEWKEVGPVLAKSYVESRALIGKKAYDIPAEDWKPDDERWQTWNKTIGVPETPDKYPAVDDALAEKAGMSKEVLAAAFQRFHAAGMTPRQVKSVLHDWYIGEAVKGTELQAKQREESIKATEAELRRVHGDKFDAKKGLIRSVLQLGGGDLADRLEAAGFGNDPALFNSLAALGEKILEDRSTKGEGSSLGPEATAAAAQKRIDEIKAARIADPNMEAKFQDPRSAEYNEWRELHKKAWPTPGAA